MTHPRMVEICGNHLKTSLTSLIPRIGFRENLEDTHSFGGERTGFP